MARIATKMKLFTGFEAEYKKRHDEIWPELSILLKELGISGYSIFLDKETNILFSVMEADDPKVFENLPKYPVMKRWWAYMKDIMYSNGDCSPVSVTLEEIFYLP